MGVFKLIKRIFFTVITLTFIGLAVFFGIEGVQHKVFDIKADAVGTNRTIVFYSPIDGRVVDTISDKSMRYTYLGDGSVRVWLGSTNKKVHSNLPFILKDN